MEEGDHATILLWGVGFTQFENVETFMPQIMSSYVSLPARQEVERLAAFTEHLPLTLRSKDLHDQLFLVDCTRIKISESISRNPKDETYSCPWHS